MSVAAASGPVGQQDAQECQGAGAIAVDDGLFGAFDTSLLRLMQDLLRVDRGGHVQARVAPLMGSPRT